MIRHPSFSVSTQTQHRGLSPLQSLTTVVFDLDGVVYRGHTLLPGAKKTIAWLRDQGVRIFFLTNNSTLTRKEYVHRLEGFGISCSKEMIYSSAYACALYLRENEGPRPRVLVVGEGGLRTELQRVGVEVVTQLRGKDVGYVVVGMDRKISYRKLADAHLAISRGAKFIASNRDPIYPVEKGVIPGGGTIVAAIETASQQKPLVIGKPSPYILKVLLRKEKIRPKECLLVGDRLDTDVVCGRRAGVWTVIVLTGVTSAEEIAQAPARLKPHWVLNSIADLPNLVAAGGGS
jgi:phosphoglycolate/pyridoxal phosphate phosphatase family enzyme